MITDELISRAYYLSGKVSREFETVSGSELADGLDMLNDILSEKAMSGPLLPYYGTTTFDTVVGQEQYTVTDLISVSSISYTLGDIRYSLQYEGRRSYFGNARINTIKTLPTMYNAERKLGGMTISLYPLPDQVYTVEIVGQFFPTVLTADTDLDPIFDRFYISYLKYVLAERICDFNGLVFDDQKRRRLKEIENQVAEVTMPDTTMKTLSVLSDEPAFLLNDATSILYQGWLP